MSYHSEVAIGMRKKDFLVLEEKAKAISDEHLKKSVWELIHDDCESIANENYQVLRWSSIKWYEEYPEIKWLMTNLPNIFSFLELGEEFEDIKQRMSVEDVDTGERDDSMYEIIQPTRDIYIGI